MGDEDIPLHKTIVEIISLAKSKLSRKGEAYDCNGSRWRKACLLLKKHSGQEGIVPKVCKGGK
jgi:hypothetical protein